MKNLEEDILDYPSNFPKNKKKIRILFEIVILLTMFVQMIFVSTVESLGNKDLLGSGLLSLLVLVMVILTMLFRYRWLKIMLYSGLIMLSILCTIAFFARGDYIMLLFPSFYSILILLIAYSKELKRSCIYAIN